MSPNNPTDLLSMLENASYDFTDPETEQHFIRLFIEAHDALLNLDSLRSVADEGSIAYARAVLTQLGIDESKLPWELGVSYNLRLAEQLERNSRPSK